MARSTFLFFEDRLPLLYIACKYGRYMRAPLMLKKGDHFPDLAFWPSAKARHARSRNAVSNDTFECFFGIRMPQDALSQIRCSPPGRIQTMASRAVGPYQLAASLDIRRARRGISCLCRCSPLAN